MNRWATRLLAFIGLSASGVASAQTQDNAGIFFYGKAPAPAQIEAAAPGARVTTTQDGRFTTTTILWPDVTLIINVNPDWNREVQLSGMKGWLENFPAAETGTPAAKAFVQNLNRTTTSYGSMIRPGYDAEGQRIVGLPGDPGKLGPR